VRDSRRPSERGRSRSDDEHRPRRTATTELVIPGLRLALLRKLRFNRQRLSQRAQELKQRLPMSTTQAVYVIAHDEGVDISEYLDTDAVAEVRALVKDLKATAAAQVTRGGRAGGRSNPAPRTVAVKLPGSEAVTDPFLSGPAAGQSKRMAELYSYVYVFENSVRGFVREVLEKHYGDDWWEKGAPRGVREKVASRKAKHGENPWHSSPSADPLSYADIDDLTGIIDKNSKHFAPLFGGVRGGYRWLTDKLNHIELHRNVAAHNNPLSRDNADELKLYCKQWQRQAKTVKQQIIARCKSGDGC